ncbi:MAG: hypothetical protein JO328_04255 [Hyphomicrobiales bacterium]|nr:hypothetical protein [Hyphomicrobiales bacterium]MBV9429284.1 hypothetical protein [Bradyrhizobiaceae bacterium]
MLNRTPGSHSTFFRLTPTFLTARDLTVHSYRVDRDFGRCVDPTANPRVTRCTIMLAVYVALQLGSVVLGIALSHKPTASSGSMMADAPKLPIDITEAF